MNEVKSADSTFTHDTTVVIPTLDCKLRPVPDRPSLNFVQRMRAGWNLGNTFDACTAANLPGDDLQYETLWVGTKTTREMIAAVQTAGFRTLRLPVSWHNHVDDEFKINQSWLDRVQEVIDYALECDLHVIMNIHHDDLIGFYYPSSEHLPVSEKYMRAIWTQLSERFRDYDDRLIFEAINEPRLRSTKHEWHLDLEDAQCLDAVECINVLNQVFVDTVRASGGRNASRYLMVPGYAANPYYAVIEQFRLPKDTVEDRLIVSAHSYSPYNFALQLPDQPGSVSHWSMDNEESTQPIDHFMDQLYDRFIRAGIPVVIGEFGAMNKDNNLQDRVDYAAYYSNAARERGMIACWWDNHAVTGAGELFGLMERRSADWVFPDIVEALIRHAPPVAE